MSIQTNDTKESVGKEMQTKGGAKAIGKLVEWSGIATVTCCLCFAMQNSAHSVAAPQPVVRRANVAPAVQTSAPTTHQSTADAKQLARVAPSPVPVVKKLLLPQAEYTPVAGYQVFDIGSHAVYVSNSLCQEEHNFDHALHQLVSAYDASMKRVPLEVRQSLAGSDLVVTGSIATFDPEGRIPRRIVFGPEIIDACRESSEISLVIDEIADCFRRSKGLRLTVEELKTAWGLVSLRY